MDGYSEETNRFIDMQNLCDKQLAINEQISAASKELNAIPKMPNDFERWIDGLSDLDAPKFTLSDFSKVFDINKRYNDLVEQREINSHKMKALVIDNIIDRINKLLKE